MYWEFVLGSLVFIGNGCVHLKCLRSSLFTWQKEALRMRFIFKQLHGLQSASVLDCHSNPASRCWAPYFMDVEVEAQQSK